MKCIHIFFAIGIILITSGQYKTVAQSSVVNREATDSRGNIILLGKSTRERLEQAPFDSWYNKNYADYTIDSATADQLKPLLGNKRFVIFMGTWCGDSRREVPRMYKLLDYCGIPRSQVTLVNVNSHDTAYKQSPEHEELGLNIHRVPDLLIYEKDKEIGRVVESPLVSWEKDLLQITGGQAYEPRYRAVNYLTRLFETSAIGDIKDNIAQMAEQVRPLVQNRSELAALGFVNMALHETDKAMLLFNMNTLLFPNDPEVWNWLAGAYLRLQDKEKAIEYYKKALSLQPNNESATTMLQQLTRQ